MRHFTAYGDSIAAGYGAPPFRGFVPQLSKIATSAYGRQVPFANLGIPGMTSYGLAAALAENPSLLLTLAQSSSAVILIGGDDLVTAIPAVASSGMRGVADALRRSAIAYRRIVQTAAAHLSGPLAVGTLYNPYPASPIAEQAVVEYNETVILPSAALAGAAVAPVYEVFSGRQSQYIAGYRDGIIGRPGLRGIRHPVHPNAAGHLAIARAFAPFVF